MNISFTFLGIHEFSFMMGLLEFTAVLKSVAEFARDKHLNYGYAAMLFFVVLIKKYDKDFNMESALRKAVSLPAPSDIGIISDIKSSINIDNMVDTAFGCVNIKPEPKAYPVDMRTITTYADLYLTTEGISVPKTVPKKELVGYQGEPPKDNSMVTSADACDWFEPIMTLVR